MTYKLFIDDERHPVTDDWMIARSSQEAIELLQYYGIPQEIAFDHDLGGDDTSMRYIRALIDFMDTLDVKFPKDFKYSVHSQNPIGRKNIESLMKGMIANFGYETS